MRSLVRSSCSASSESRTSFTPGWLRWSSAKSARKTDRVSPSSSADDGRGAPRVGPEQRELAEDAAGADHVEEHAVADLRPNAAREVAAHDEVQRLGQVVAVEDHLALLERASAGDREQLSDVVRREARRGAATPRRQSARRCVASVTLAVSRSRTTASAPARSLLRMTAPREEDRLLMHGGLVLGTTAAMGASPSVARAGSRRTEGSNRVVESEVVESQSVRSHLLRSQLVELALAAALYPYKRGRHQPRDGRGARSLTDFSLDPSGGRERGRRAPLQRSRGRRCRPGGPGRGRAPGRSRREAPTRWPRSRRRSAARRRP